MSEEASKAAVDKAVPLAVQAAVAQYAGDLAIQYDRNQRLITGRGVFRAIVLSIAAGQVASWIMKNEPNSEGVVRSSYVVGGAVGAFWLLKDELPYLNWNITGELPLPKIK